jgi:hypothetical protein
MMSQFNAPIRRSDSGLNVYTGLLFVAFLVLVGGVGLLAMRNMEHSKVGNDPGGIVKLVQSR